MNTLEALRASLIDKIISIRNPEYLQSLDDQLSSSSHVMRVSLTEEQNLMLLMSEEDISSGRTITQNELDRLDSEWLKSQ